jgi:ATP-dependent RNA helicase DDX10/DBP4
MEAGDVRFVGTPQGLSQSYSVVEPHDKLSVLWSFIKTHLKSKVIVFFATGKQVRFAYDSFCKLRPGIPLLHIHGNMKQAKRTDMYDLFCRTSCAVLFATDIASRGLDFPDVEWVVQVDCPDDVSSYVHRVGRTARFRSNGRAMLFLNKGSEESFLKRLEARKLRLNPTRINPERITSITPRIAALVAQSQSLKSVAQRAFLFYLKSVHRQGDKEVFNAVDMDHAAFATSLGLAAPPKVTFKGEAKRGSTTAAAAKMGDGKTVFGYRPRVEGDKTKKSAKKRSLEEKDGDIDDDDGGDDGDILVMKKADLQAQSKSGSVSGEEVAENEEVPLPAPAARKRKRIKLDILKHGSSGNRIVFSDDGTAMRASDALRAELGVANDPDAAEGDARDIEAYASVVAKRLEETAEQDKARERERVRAKHLKRKEKLRGKRIDAADAANHGDLDGGDSDSSRDDEFSAALARIAARDREASGDGSEASDVDDMDLAEQALRILEQRRHG